MATSKIEAKNKPCIFIFLASKHPKNKLLICEIEADNQISLDPEENNKSHNFHDFEIQLLFENELLKNKLKERFNSQQDRMEAIIEIAKKERNNLYDNLTNLMEDHNRFHLDSFLNYSPSQWLTVDVIYGMRHLKYVSVINLAASAIKYSVVRSRSIVDIDNYFISAGSFTKFIKWQENLAGEPQPFQMVTSFVLFNFDPTNQVQNIKNPWLHENLNTAQIEQLFNITPEMQTLIDQRLHDYLSDKKKWCRECSKDNINNSKRKCLNVIQSFLQSQKFNKKLTK
ncbi:hypothetical protein C2G38_2189481 [Gigaspora rosea]|uniref:Uncharacterized protein n=1 Tax=Gigaspora rosea TaxID=44941 RepID=A0A397V3W6_9GLOM|nr:hypothetical protein C2G38_2189481 [Gigaspora rosea]